MTETQWEAVQDEPHGEALFTYSGIVYTYNPALENPYESQPDLAQAFSRMVGEAYDVTAGLSKYFLPEAPQDAARMTLLAYFSALNAGRYSEASRLLAGDFDTLWAMNPDISPDSPVALFESACTRNGFLCSLQVAEILEVTEVSPREFRFRLTFELLDGTPFELGPCCGEEPNATAPVREFDYTVRLDDGRYGVLELPVYTP
jgi:hypothetical protein